jgi:putative NADH-flavin reductase
MARIAVIGGTGYAGRHIVAEAVDRGHTVVSVARSVPAERVEGATYVEGTLLDVPGLLEELDGVDVIVSAVAPRGDMLGSLRPSIAQLAEEVPPGVRLGIIGGAGGSLVEEDGERVVDQPYFTEEYKPEASKPSTSSRTSAATTATSTGSSSTRPAASAPSTRASAPAPIVTAATCS